MFFTKHKSYHIGSKFDFDKTAINSLVELFNFNNPKKPDTILTGRNLINEITIPDIGPLVIKRYLRGGFVARFNKDRYIYSKKIRSELEFNALDMAAKAGVNVPEPIAFAKKGTLIYRTWLITRKIENAENYIELCLKNCDQAASLLPLISDNIIKLIKSSIHHKDLHPGNIIIDKSDKPFILDFDKACDFKGSKKELADRYIQRWQRAVKKYNLPEELLEIHL